MANVRYLYPEYDFIDSDGELMLVMEAQKGAADDENAGFTYDKNYRAILKRNKNQIICLPLLGEKVQNMLAEDLSKILVTEMKGDEIFDVYEAAVSESENDLIFPHKTKE